MSYLAEDGPHVDPTTDPAEVSGLTVESGIAPISTYGKWLVEQRRNSTTPALGAPEIAPQESPDSGGGAGSTDAGALSSTSGEYTSGEAPEPGGELDEAMNGEAQFLMP